MPEQNPKPTTLCLSGTKLPSDPLSLPSALRGASRSNQTNVDPFLNGLIQVHAVYQLSATARSDSTAQIRHPLSATSLLALEAADGTTFFIRADALQENLTRLYPHLTVSGELDFTLLRDRAGADRGLGDWFWNRLSVFDLGRDAIIDAARDKAMEWVKETLGEQVEAALDAGASFLGAKALMWAIESRLAGEPGLYRWTGAELNASDRLAPGCTPLKNDALAGPILVFIHGTASHTFGCFKDLHGAGARDDWETMTRPFQGRIYGFEHPTFSESPIDNALMLARTLPAGARVSLVTHSRGGLVGDLFCLGGLEEDLIQDYRREAPVNEEEKSWQKLLREKLAIDEQQKLRELRDLLNQKAFVIDRYVRVASPSQGTTLLSDNLDLFLSGLLSISGKLIGALTGPAGSAIFFAFQRIVLEVAHKRIQARFVPGLEAMLADSPLATLLARGHRKQGVRMAVITGTTAVDSGVLKRIGVMFTDWMFFDQQHNDLVVDTQSMYGGLAVAGGASLFDGGPEVTHFSYFRNARTRGPIRDWLSQDAPEKLSSFTAIAVLKESTDPDVDEKARKSDAVRGNYTLEKRPIVVLLPDMMGSHLKAPRAQGGAETNRVWFDLGDLIRGGLDDIRYGNPFVQPDGIWEFCYGALAEFLETNYHVIRFAYDWRAPLQDGADKLALLVQDLRSTHPRQSVRLIAHGMGGLVARMFICQQSLLWAELVTHADCRLIMLGTPNNGTHHVVQTLLGKSESIRKLARVDLGHDLQGVLNIFAEFPGLLQLLPRPTDKDPRSTQGPNYYDAHTWSEKFKCETRDRWFGDHIVATPSQKLLDQARASWSALTDHVIPNPERISYVFGQADITPCGLNHLGEGDQARLRLEGTVQGDGIVTWASGRLNEVPPENHFFMPVGHGALTQTADYFPALGDLIESGKSNQFKPLPTNRGAVESICVFDAGPVPYPTAEELARSVIADKPKRRSARGKLQILKVSVRAIDLRFVDTPILCGHYLGDTIAGAEKEIDRLMNGALSQRERLGVYAYQRGTSAVVLNVRNVADVLRGSCKGAVVVGLGEYGKLSTTDITETVRAGVLRLLLHSHDLTNTIRSNKEQRGLTLSSLLIGQNSNMHISVQDSIDAIVLGVCEANRQYAETTQLLLRVTQLEFIEVYLDTAITAAREVLDVSGRLEKDLRRLDAHVEPARQLIRDIGVRQRLQINAAPGYWPRLIVTDASSPDVTQTPKADASSTLKPKLAEKLKYVYLSERARAEAVVLQRQPGLIEALLKEAIRQDSINHDISHTLFQLMVPLELKAAARQTESLVLVVDEYTANLPWEMLVADGLPLVLKTKIVRQLITLNYRPVVRSALRPMACVIGNPSTLGYFEHFEGQGQSDTGYALQNLPGAAKEAACVRETLERSGYIVELCPPEREALDVLNCIYKQPYRVLMIAGHGVFNALTRDGTRRSGVVLSGGILFTAAEISQMEVVPEVVFLNCCHLGQIDSSAHFNRLAASVSRELIEMGVRCVIAAGWQVNDDAASLFAETFFSALALEKQPFGSAVWLARKHTYERFPNLNTWGAYQAYGDPEYVLDPTLEPNKRDHDWIPVAPEELLDALASLLLDETLTLTKASTKIERLLNKSPQEWRDRPDVQAAIGDIFAKFRTDGFPQASLALQNAIAGEDTLGRVAVRTIETLARLEMNVGIDKGGAEGLKWVEQALDRVQGLLDISSASGRNTSGAIGRNTQSSDSFNSVKSHNDARWMLLADAWMSKAVLLNQQRQSWSKKVVPALGKSASAYQRAAGKVEQLTFNPSPILNQLIVETLIGAFTPEQIKEGKVRAEFCKKKAQERFSENNNYADAVLTVEAELLMCLLGGTLNADIERLSAQVRECVEMASPSDAEIKDFAIRWQRFCDFLERREGARSVDVNALKTFFMRLT